MNRQDSKSKDSRMKRGSKNKADKGKDEKKIDVRAVIKRKSFQNNHRKITKNQKEKTKCIVHLIATIHEAKIKKI